MRTIELQYDVREYADLGYGRVHTHICKHANKTHDGDVVRIEENWSARFSSLSEASAYCRSQGYEVLLCQDCRPCDIE